ncbi:MAG: hypothetical protein JW855_06185 [Gammaproteobacteria bacterium]|nr:hypothetical protein [Gammaproteobacteria bacterium]
MGIRNKLKKGFGKVTGKVSNGFKKVIAKAFLPSSRFSLKQHRERIARAQLFLDAHNSEIQGRFQSHLLERTLDNGVTLRGLSLDVLGGTQKPKKQKIILHMCANGMTSVDKFAVPYMQNHSFTDRMNYLRRHPEHPEILSWPERLMGDIGDPNVTVMCIDYPGVFCSDAGGHTLNFKFISECMTQFVNSLIEEDGILPENILIHGHSMGGFVGARVASKTGTNFISERSGGSLDQLAGKIIPWIPGVEKLTRALDWGTDTVQDYQNISGQKGIIYAKNHSQGEDDEMIGYEQSLYRMLKKRTFEEDDIDSYCNAKLNAIRVTTTGRGSMHMTEIYKCNPELWNKFIDMTKQFLHIGDPGKRYSRKTLRFRGAR